MMNLKIEIQKNIFLKTAITNHSRFKDPFVYFYYTIFTNQKQFF